MQGPVRRPPGVTRRRPRSSRGAHRAQGSTGHRYGIGLVVTCATAALIALPSAGVALSAADWSAALGPAGLPAPAAAPGADDQDVDVPGDVATRTDEPSAGELRDSEGHDHDGDEKEGDETEEVPTPSEAPPLAAPQGGTVPVTAM